jgi:hypothetical protein
MDQQLTLEQFEVEIIAICEEVRRRYRRDAPDRMDFEDWWELLDMEAAEARIHAVDALPPRSAAA